MEYKIETRKQNLTESNQMWSWTMEVGLELKIHGMLITFKMRSHDLNNLM